MKFYVHEFGFRSRGVMHRKVLTERWSWHHNGLWNLLVKTRLCLPMKVRTQLPDPWRFDSDTDPQIRTTGLRIRSHNCKNQGFSTFFLVDGRMEGSVEIITDPKGSKTYESQRSVSVSRTLLANFKMYWGFPNWRQFFSKSLCLQRQQIWRNETSPHFHHMLLHA